MNETTVRFFLAAAGLIIVALVLGVDLGKVAEALLWVRTFLSS